MNINVVMFGGRLTRDPELRQLPSQTVVCEFGMCANRKWRGTGGEEREEACFVDVTAFGKQAELISQYAHKGSELFVQARLKFETWEDRNGGGKRSKLALVVENFQFVGRRDDDGGERRGEYDQRPQPRRSSLTPGAPTSQAHADAKRRQNPPEMFDGEGGPPTEQRFQEDDIPFLRPTPSTGQRVGLPDSSPRR